MDHENRHTYTHNLFPALIVSIIRSEFQKSDTLTVRQIHALIPGIAGVHLVRMGFKTLIAENFCTKEGSKRGSKYVLNQTVPEFKPIAD
jgi:hypothetical protein